MLKSLYGVWKPSLNGLTQTEILGIHVLKNITDQRIVHAPAVETECAGLESQEVAAEPGEVICYVKQSFLPGQQWESRVVVGSEKEITSWIAKYFFEPYQSAADVEVVNGEIRIMGVPLTIPVLKSYSDQTRHRFEEILRQKKLSLQQQKVVDNLMRIASR